ncbi:MAG: TIGR02186 family protein [Alphaproteobacteria bacterium]|jgi:uncharacterized protein (TIGR02186 family)
MMVQTAPVPPSVSAALTTTEVRVTSGFQGARIVLYGAVFDPSHQPSDIVVLVRGPEQPIRIAHKVRIAGLWINSRPVVFHGAPGFYMAASTRPLDQIAGFGVLRRLGAGIDHLAINAPAEQRVETRYGVKDVVVNRLGADYLDWRQAVVRLKAKMGLYEEDDHGVIFVDQNLFKADITLPTDAPIGRYQAQILLFQNGQPVSQRVRELDVKKVGLQRSLYLFAHFHPWTYGLVSVSIALAAGWAASAAFRRS